MPRDRGGQQFAHSYHLRASGEAALGMLRAHRLYDPVHNLVLPPSPCYWLPENHLRSLASDPIQAMALDYLHARVDDVRR